MEKLSTDRKKINEAFMENTLINIYSNSEAKSFIDKNNINRETVIKEFLPFLQFVEDKEICQNCNGLTSCSKKGFNSELIVDYYGRITNQSRICEKHQNLLDKKNNYIWQDFPDDLLNAKTDKSEQTDNRKSFLRALFLMAKMQHNKNIFLKCTEPIGKHLLICWSNYLTANRIIDDKIERGDTVAFIDMKEFIENMRDLINDKTGIGKQEFKINIKKIKAANILVLINLGNERPSDFTKNDILYEILDSRKDIKQFRNVLHSNFDYKELSKLYSSDNGVKSNKLMELIGKSDFYDIQ